jgi:BNR repeat-containing family member
MPHWYHRQYADKIAPSASTLKNFEQMEPMKSLTNYFSFTPVGTLFLTALSCLPAATRSAAAPATNAASQVTLNQKDDGYRGIWYMNQPTKDKYAYKYSGGLGTYCDYHAPFAVYAAEVDKTFFCYGGAPVESNRRLLHMVSFFDHQTGTVPRPTLLLDKQTSDAHDNPVISLDGNGYVWIFSTAHGAGRPAYIHRSKKPYDIDEFDLIEATRRDGAGTAPIDNFSYFQVFHNREHGYQAIFTRYGFPAARTACFMTSPDGVHWSEWQRLAAIEQGHYQIGAAANGKVATMLNMHPAGKGLNWRTNLYYLESANNGATWTTVDGTPVSLPLTEPVNSALVRDYRAEELLVYIKDLQLDAKGRPVLVYSTSRGYQPGPENGERELMLARWIGDKWKFHTVTTSDHNYDSASLSFEADGTWRIISPTLPGPQPFGTGGEMALWMSSDQGATWQLEKQLTAASERNHTYARRPVNAHPDFFAIWADGNARKPSQSNIYFCDAEGKVYMLPRQMNATTAKPIPVAAAAASAPAGGE